MARPNKPHWHTRNGCFRCTIAGKLVDFRPGLVEGFDRPIAREERPLIDGVPKRAWDVLERYKAAVAARRVDLVDPTVFAVCQLYLQHAEGERDAGRVTAGNYSGHVTHLGRFWSWSPPTGGGALGDRKASSLGPDDLEAFCGAVRAEGLSPHYVCNLAKSVQAAFNWAARPVRGRTPVRYLAVNPLQGWRPPKPPKAGAEKYLDAGAFLAFTRWALRRARAGGALTQRFDLLFVRQIWFLALTGARPGEACGLRWSDVDWRRSLIVLRDWKNRKKTGEVREIHLTPPVSRLLRRIERVPDRHPEWVFTHRRGRGQSRVAGPKEGVPWNSVAFGAKFRQWRELAAAAGVAVSTEGAGRFVPYLLRHTYISDGLMGGLSEAEVGHLAGTSAQMVARTYGHIQRAHAARRATELAEQRRRLGSKDETPGAS